MRSASAEFLQEEALLRGARRRVKAVIFPFDLDYGLGPESGTFEHTRYGGEPGKVEMEEDYSTSGSWTSPLMQAFSPRLETVVAAWEDQAGYLEARVYLRGASEAHLVAGATYTALVPGEESPLFPYFQVRVEFTSTFRSWAVEAPEEADSWTAYGVDWPGDPDFDSFTGEGEFPGYIAGLSLEGRLTLPESDILNLGEVRVELARDFAGLRGGSHVLTLDNRTAQWLPGGGPFYFLGLPGEEKRLALFHGFELPNGQVEWLPLYQGVLSRLGGLAEGWQERHRATLETQDWITHRLNRRLGSPTPTGDRQPFLRGFYRAQGELLTVSPAELTEPVKTGSGSASLRILGTYRGQEDTTFLFQAESTGEVGTATFRWSTNTGQSWQETGRLTAGAEDPVELSDGLAAYWEAGIGTDLVAGDRFTFTAKASVYHYRIYGGPFEEISAVYLNREETWEGVTADPETGEILVTGRSAQVSARVVKDGITHPVDIMEDVLSEVGLGEAIHQDSFALARSLTPEYAVGVCFENIPASQALREILRRTLYDLWVDFGEIKIRAYLGEE